MQLLLAGIVLSLLGSLPPGLISLSVAQTAIQRGFVMAMLLAGGAAFAEFFQAWAAVLLTDWFLTHPGTERLFQWAALPVFWVLALYLLFWAKPPRPRADAVMASPLLQIGKGILISAFNLLAIPYWFIYCGWLRVAGYWQAGLLHTLVFALGVTVGTLLSLSLYAWMGREIVRRSDRMARQVNRVVGFIFFLLGLKILMDLLR